MTGAHLLKMGNAARQMVECHCDRQFKEADLADAYVRCAADQLDNGDYSHSLRLLQRAGEVCPAYKVDWDGIGGTL